MQHDTKITIGIISGLFIYHIYHYNLSTKYKHNLVLDIDDTIGKSIYMSHPTSSELYKTIKLFGNKYKYMYFDNLDGNRRDLLFLS